MAPRERLQFPFLQPDSLHHHRTCTMMPAETVVTGLVRESPARRPAGREILALTSGGLGDGGKRCVAAALAACRAGSGSSVELWFTGSAVGAGHHGPVHCDGGQNR